jgi:hypothetical protein
LAENPLNLAVRFALELAALAALAYWGWTRDEGLLRIVLAVGLPLLAAVLWAVFRTPGDDARAAIVAVPGIVRLLLEFALFGTAVALLASAGHARIALVFGAIVLLHYLVSYDRVMRLLFGRS